MALISSWKGTDMPEISEKSRQPNIVDFHTHLLPDMDDGSDGVETSAGMLASLAEQGVTVVCATSHYYAWRESVDSFVNRRAQAAERLTPVLPPQIQRLILGAEAAYFPRISESRHLDSLCLQGTHTLLVEMPFADWNQRQVEEIIALVLDRDYRVVLVHPERFLFSKGNLKSLEKLAELPLSFQINTDALLHWNSRKMALSLLEMTGAPLLGTDCHNLHTRAPHMEKARSVVRAKLGEQFLQKIDQNARQFITGVEG